MSNSTITKKEEWDAIAAEFHPYFLEYLKKKGTSVDSIEEYRSLEGVRCLPARLELGGVRKTVLVPVSILCKDALDAADNANRAAQGADEATARADQATDRANASAQRADEATADLSREKTAVLEACDAANSAADAANSAADSANTAMADFASAEAARVEAEESRRSAESLRAEAEDLRDTAEQLRDTAEASRQEAETNRVADTSKALTDVKQATATLEELNANPPRIQNGTWWLYSLEDKAYVNTEVKAVGRSPYIDSDTLQWMTFDDNEGRYVDSGVSAMPYDVTDDTFVDTLMAQWD